MRRILYPMEVELSTKIESLSFGGCGVGRISGKVVFVPYSAPGDEVKIEITREEKGFMEGDIVELMSPSPMRKSPVCRYHAICGGCHWLHIPYDKQLRAKEEIFKDTLRRIGKIEPSIVKPINPSPLEFNYRSRVQFKVWEDRVGFYRRGSHELVDIPECPLAHPLINRILKAIRNIWPKAVKSVARIDINVSPSANQGIVSIYLKERTSFDFSAFFKTLNRETHEAVGLILHVGREEKIFGSPFLFSLEGEFRFRASEGSFSQVNYMQNINMKEYVMSLAALKGDETVVELYSGGGNFAIPLSRASGRVFGVEVSASSISDAVENASMNNIRNAAFIQAVSEKGLDRLGAYGCKSPVDMVLVDPPRDGCSMKVIEGIVSLRPKKVIYVSCNPSTLARDLSRFRESGFSVTSSKPFDMFPQTYHIESVTQLTFS